MFDPKSLSRRFAAVAIAVSVATSGAVASAETTASANHESQASRDVQVVHQDERSVTTEGADGTIKVTRNDESDTLTIEYSDGRTETITTDQAFDLINSYEQNSPSPKRSKRGIEKDWRKYMCSAATAAVVGGHQKAWSVALALISAHPAIKAAVMGGHFAAGVFLSTQC